MLLPDVEHPTVDSTYCDTDGNGHVTYIRIGANGGPLSGISTKAISLDGQPAQETTGTPFGFSRGSLGTCVPGAIDTGSDTSVLAQHGGQNSELDFWDGNRTPPITLDAFNALLASWQWTS